MFMNLLMAESLQGFPAATDVSSGGRSGSSAGKADAAGFSFGDVLDSTVNGRNSSAADRSSNFPANTKSCMAGDANDTRNAPKARDTGYKANKAADEDTGNQDVKPQPKTFRQVYSENKMKAVNSAAENTKSPEGEKVDAAGTASSDNTNAPDGGAAAVINCLSQMLGLLPDQLKSLLEEAGVKPEEISSLQGVKDAAAKLSSVLNLNGSQSKALEEIMQMVSESVAPKGQARVLIPDVNSKTVGTAGQTQQDGASASTMDTAAQQLETIVVKPAAQINASEFSALAAKLKMKLDELGEKLQADSTGVLDEIASCLKPGKAAVDSTNAYQTEASLAKTGTPVKKEDIKENNSSVAAGKEKADKVSEDDSTVKVNNKTQPAEASLAANKAKVAEPVKTEVIQPVAPSAAPVQKIDIPLNTEKVEAKTAVTPADIMKQVVEKAKVILTGDKSEMVMDLKPDSLGKLSLKVVTEHGLVTARFIAESQQVKQVLETNMQLLKDSLEKQGLNVQGFSVSVRQDGQRGYGSNDGTGGTDRSKQTRISFPGSTAYVTSAAPEETGRTSQYGWSPSTINLTA